MNHKTVFLSLLIILFAAGHARAEVKDACTLISNADAQAVLGEAVGPGKPASRSSGSADGSACTFRSLNGGALAGKTVSLSIRYSTGDVSGSAPAIADSMRSTGYANVHPVTGIGDAAVWGTINALGRSTCELTVLKGKYIVIIVLIKGLPDDATTLERTKHLAAAALART